MTTPMLLFTICESCGDRFLSDDDDETLCPACRARLIDWK